MLVSGVEEETAWLQSYLGLFSPKPRATTPTRRTNTRHGNTALVRRTTRYTTF